MALPRPALSTAGVPSLDLWALAGAGCLQMVSAWHARRTQQILRGSVGPLCTPAHGLASPSASASTLRLSAWACVDASVIFSCEPGKVGHVFQGGGVGYSHSCGWVGATDQSLEHSLTEAWPQRAVGWGPSWSYVIGTVADYLYHDLVEASLNLLHP